MATPDISLKLAERLSAVVNASFESGEMLEKVTPVTAELLKFWFCCREYNLLVSNLLRLYCLIYSV